MDSSRCTFWSRSLLVAVLLATAACQTAPVQEMSDARQAITVAKEAGAAEYATVELKAAEDFLMTAERSLFQRDYALARDSAMQAKVEALNALKVSDANRDSDGP